jgi:hypothetical protein
MQSQDYLDRSARPRGGGGRMPFANLAEGQLVSAPFMVEHDGWTDKERRAAWGKMNIGNEKFWGGSITLIHRLHKTLDISYFDGYKAVHVPMQFVQRTEYKDCASEALAKEVKAKKNAAKLNKTRAVANIHGKATALKGYPWKHTGTRTMRFSPALGTGPKLALADRLLMDNSFALYMGGKWVDQPDLETVSLRQAVNSIHSDVYVRAIWYCAHTLSAIRACCSHCFADSPCLQGLCSHLGRRQRSRSRCPQDRLWQCRPSHGGGRGQEVRCDSLWTCLVRRERLRTSTPVHQDSLNKMEKTNAIFFK